MLILTSIAAAHYTRRRESQHDITQDNGNAQERAANEFTHRAAGVVAGAGAAGLGSAAGSRGIARAGGVGGWEGGSNNRRSGGDGNGGSPRFNLVINTGNERSQVGALHVVGEVEQFNPRNRTREVLRRGEVRTLSINDDCVPASA